MGSCNESSLAQILQNLILKEQAKATQLSWSLDHAYKNWCQAEVQLSDEPSSNGQKDSQLIKLQRKKRIVSAVDPDLEQDYLMQLSESVLESLLNTYQAIERNRLV